jgi:hypothetical protein
MAKRFLSQEDLAVDKQYKKEQTIDSNSNTDNLLALAKSKLDSKDSSENSSENEDLSADTDYDVAASQNPSDHTVDLIDVDVANTTDNYNDDSTSYLYSDTQISTGSSNMLNASGGQEDLNAGQEHYLEAAQIAMAMEDLYTVAAEDWADTAKSAAAQAGRGLTASLGYLKDLGIQYGPGIAKAIGKTAIYAITMALKGLFKGTKSLVKAIDNSLFSYKKINARIAKLQETISLIEQSKKDIAPSESLFKDKKIIFNISNTNEFKPYSALEDYSNYVKYYLSQISQRAQTELTAIRILSSSILSSQVSAPEKLMHVKEASEGLVKGTLQGYAAPSEYVEVYHYAKNLPGHITLLAYLPKEDLTDPSEIYTAYHQSQFFYGYNLNQVRSASAVPFLNLSDCKKLLKKVSEVTKESEVIVSELKSLKSLKDTIALNLKGLLGRISDKIQYKNTNSKLIEYISLKMYFIQRCYSTQLIEADRQNRKIITNYCRYIEASLKELLSNIPKD